MPKLSEEDTKLRYITPAIVDKAGWQHDQMRMEAFAPGQIEVHGTKTKRGKAKKADYLLVHKETGKNLAVVEAKAYDETIGTGLQQAIKYATILDAPFAYSTNGHGFIERDFLTGIEREIPLDQFPTEAQLWERFTTGKGYDAEALKVVEQPYYFNPFDAREPRYYQRVAIDRTLEAIARGDKRLLLVMATGTGKTYTAFQIVWRLLQARKVRRVLYLADRNILVDQPMNKDFRPLSNVVTKVENKNLDPAYEVYFSLYQQHGGDPGEELFRQFKPEFFDLIIIDECHRGSAKEQSQWRRILDYFNSAIHLGLTATPKETKDISNFTYFGEPIYTYSLKQGIDDGFLAPYKVIRVGLNVDSMGWRPERGKLDKDGFEVEDREYNTTDYDRNLVIDERTTEVAKYITSWLKKYGPESKTIVFCIDQEHAERTRMALVNENPEMVKKDHRYVMRITSDDKEGKAELDNFQRADEPNPTIVTTSKLLTTGVDVPTLKLIVLDSIINSMTEFKQIIGRGTRLDEANGKEFFTIMDFRGSTRLFADPDFDGDPVVVMDIPEPEIDDDGDLIWPDDEEEPDHGGADGGNGIDGDEWPPDMPPDWTPDRKVRVNGVDVHLQGERVQFVDPRTGKLMSESVTKYSRDNMLSTYATLDAFLHDWNDADKKAAILNELADNGVFLDAIREEMGEAAEGMDDFDLILHVAYDKPPKTKAQRIKNVVDSHYLAKFSDDCVVVLEGLLDKYGELGVTEMENTQVLSNPPFNQMGGPVKIVQMFGGRDAYFEAVQGLQSELYADA